MGREFMQTCDFIKYESEFMQTCVFFYKDLSTGQYVLCDCVCLLLDGINMPLVGDKRWK